MTDLRYPIGELALPDALTPAERLQAIEDLRVAPALLRRAVKGLDDARLDAPYRPGGWTVRQLVHHVADSHLNAYARMKLILTEEEPTLKTYDQDRWAVLGDTALPIEVSLTLLECLHERWAAALDAVDDDASWRRRARHPDLGSITLEQLLALYAWHCRHHVAHVVTLREREGWH